jgi:hypothetical protein
MAYNVRERILYVDLDKKGINFIDWMKTCTDDGAYLEPLPISFFGANLKRTTVDNSLFYLFPKFDRLVPRSDLANCDMSVNGMYATRGRLMPRT